VCKSKGLIFYGLLPKWFGHLCYSRDLESLWAELNFYSDNLVIDYYTGQRGSGSVYHVRKYGLVRLCNWMFSTARRYDQQQLSLYALPHTPRLLSPFVDELRRLLFRAYAYQERVRRLRRWNLNPAIPDSWLSEFSNFSRHFGLLLEAFREFIKDRMTYVVALKGERSNSERGTAFWPSWTLGDR
jgi:hypothetical protein